MGMIIGCIGFVLNVISATILHEHDHDAQEAAGVPQSAHLELPVSYGTTASCPLHTLEWNGRGADPGIRENNVDPCTTITVMKHWIGPEEAKMATLVSWVSRSTLGATPQTTSASSL